MSNEQNTKPAAATGPQGRLDALVSDICGGVNEPMSINEIADYISSNDYSAELALQHAIMALHRAVARTPMLFHR